MSHPESTIAALPVRMSERTAFDLSKYKARTLRSDMTLFKSKPDWAEAYWTFVVRMLQNILISVYADKT